MDFKQTLASGKVLLFDGAMGSLLASMGGDMRSGHNNLTSRDLVEKAHRLYLEAGSDCLTTNSFSLNRIYSDLTDQQLDDSLRAAMEAALQAADGHAFVFGDMGPTGQMLPPYGNGDANQIYEAYCRQVETMAAYPLSGLIVETVFHLAEAELMLQACHDQAPQLPVVFTMTFCTARRGGATMMGDRTADICAFAQKHGVAALGANCGDLNPKEYPPIIEGLKQAGLPVLLQPNAGKPQYAENNAVSYPLSPQEFAAEMALCRQAGAQLLGGCCGTTPEHIRQLRIGLAEE
ncbi:MAG: homocysteine S-methyltransferase family protein [Firmicutes bacterium]|nr:homocysteine S-methyltransferase family protein [Bacillota bacterium]